MAQSSAHRLVGLITVVLCVAGCGSSGGGKAPPTGGFTEDDAWTGRAPTDATELTPEDFRARVDSDEIVVRSSGAVDATRAARQTRYDDDKDKLVAIPNPGPAVEALLDELAEQPTVEGERPVDVPGAGTVVLYGLGTQARNAVDSYELSQRVDNATTAYQQVYDLLPTELRATVPTPASLDGKPLADVDAALAAVESALAGASTKARLEPRPAAPGAPTSNAKEALRPGAGTDHDASCAAPTGLAAQYWFPLKRFVSPVKNQAKRGTCWAFAAIGSVESRERVQNGNTYDLSEQFLVNKVKQDWDSDDYSDGYWSDRALNTAVDRGQALLAEGGWTYNPATGRPSVKDGDEDSYDNTCTPYGEGPNAGTCSKTAHESRRYCTDYLLFDVCGYARVNFGGPGVAASRAYNVWTSGQRFDLDRYRFLLDQGVVLLASFPVYRGFMDDAAGGVVSNYAKTRLDGMGKEVSGSYGGHEVQIVAFIDNAALSKPGRPAVNIGGGGYFIIKNSWGCGAGDGGYYYVPADYVSGSFSSLDALAFDSRRSDAWNREQANPGGSEPLKVELLMNPARVDLRVPTDIARFFRVSHPVAKSVHLNISAGALGVIYDGAWSTDPDALFGPSFRYTFAQAGSVPVTLTATYGDVVASARLTINVINSPPLLSVETSGDAFVGEPYVLTAKVIDQNETDAAMLCKNTTWTVEAPDTVSDGTGCKVQVTFASEGARKVTVATHDSEGLVTTRSLSVAVMPAPVNPYPRITNGGVQSSEARFIQGMFLGCQSPAVALGATIDLSESGCVLFIGETPPRYSSFVTVENPDAEALTYDWRLYVTYEDGDHVYESAFGSTKASMPLVNVNNACPTTVPCRVNVVVHAPDPSRDKTQTVWTGQCSLEACRIN